MDIKLFQKCGDVCQQRIAGILLVLLGVMSFGIILFVLLSF
jgi:hypothetical protein